MNLNIKLYWLKIPLKNPYYLPFQTVYEYDSMVVRLQSGRGALYWGEVTALPGYSWETAEEIWQTLKRWVLLAKGSLIKLISTVRQEQVVNPFAAAPLLVAIEKMLTPLKVESIKPIPIVGILSTDNLAEIEVQAIELMRLGYQTIKIKVKGNVDKDLQKVGLLQSKFTGNTLIRIDANQGYTLEGMKRFISYVDPVNIEFFEQPFRPEAWEEMKELAKMTPIPLMLDESIWSEKDIAKVIELQCVKYVKLKLAKHSSMAETIKLINLAQRNGLSVVLGNGVQTEIGCLDEAAIYQEGGLKTVAEMNGFLKQTVSLLKKPLRFKKGKFYINETPVVNMGTIEEYSIMHLESDVTDDIKKDRGQL